MFISLWNKFIALAASIVADPQDSDTLHQQKTLLVATSLMIIATTMIFSLIYLLFNEPVPLVITTCAAGFFFLSMFVFHAPRHYASYHIIAHLMILLLPFIMSLALGGFSLSSGVILWALLAPIEALVVRAQRMAIRLFVGYLALLIALALLQPVLRMSNNLPPLVVTLFYVLNLGTVSAIAFLILFEAFVRERKLEKEVLELRIEIDQAKKQEDVNQIVDSEYFQDLMNKSKQIRRSAGTDQPPAD